MRLADIRRQAAACGAAPCIVNCATHGHLQTASSSPIAPAMPAAALAACVAGHPRLERRAEPCPASAQAPLWRIPRAAAAAGVGRRLRTVAAAGGSGGTGGSSGGTGSSGGGGAPPAAAAVEYVDGPTDIAFIGLCRVAYAKIAGWQSERSWTDGGETFKGMVEVSVHAGLMHWSLGRSHWCVV